ncbi:MAG: ABC transporter substrate-binding protein [Pyrinomonadaceae bacterium]
MRRQRLLLDFFQPFLLLLLLALITFSAGCRTQSADSFTIALDSKFSTLDPLGSATVDANAERLRTLMFNTLVKKNEKFEYVGDLANEINTSPDGSMLTFVLRDNVKFQDGKPLTATDVKYTLDTMLKSSGAKASAFFESVGGEKKPMIVEIGAPDAKTLTIKLARPALKNNLLSNLVAIAIIPEGTFDKQKDSPLGSGAYKFVRFDTSQNVVELIANDDYWEGAPNIKTLRVKTVADANALQAELKSGRVQLAPMTINISPDTFKSLATDPNLKVEQFPGGNIQYLGFNTQSKPLDNPKVRQAIAYAIKRELLIDELLFGQAKIAYSILPEESWAYSPGIKYSYNQEKSKMLLDEAGFKPDANGKRFSAPIKFKIAAGNAATSQYAQVIQNQLKEVGIPVEIEPVDFNTLLVQLQQGQYQMTTARWVGGNQDPIFLRDLFASSEIPSEKRASRNRSRYSNPEFDKVIEQAVNEIDREKAKVLYIQAQEIVSRDVPMLPLWYPANMVVSSSKVGNVKVEGSGDWFFVRNLTYQK